MAEDATLSGIKSYKTMKAIVNSSRFFQFH
jgi:hypothetical protein